MLYHLEITDRKLIVYLNTKLDYLFYTHPSEDIVAIKRYNVFITLEISMYYFLFY